MFMNEIYSEQPKQNYITNSTDAYHFGDIWRLDILDLKDHGNENNKGTDMF